MQHQDLFLKLPYEGLVDSLCLFFWGGGCFMKDSKLYWNLSSTSYLYINISFFGMHLCATYHMCCKLIGPIDIIFKLKLESAMPSTRIQQQDFKGAALPHTIFT